MFCYVVFGVLFSLYNYLVEKKRAGCFTLIVFLLSCVCLCSVSHPILQRTYRKMTILWPFSYNSFVIVLAFEL